MSEQTQQKTPAQTPKTDADLLRLLNKDANNDTQNKDDARARLKSIGLGYEKGASTAKLDTLSTL